MDITKFPFPMTREERYTSEHFEAWQDGDFPDDHCSLCIAWHAEQIIEEAQYQSTGHDWSTSDHCLNCGCEIYEGKDAYEKCKGGF